MSSMGLRQALLDHLNLYPESTPREIWLAFGQGVELATVSRCLTEMARNRVCTRTQDLKERGAPFRYTAVVMLATASSPRGAPKQKANDAPGHTVHNDPKRRPIRNPDSMGCLCGFMQTCMILGE